MSRRLNDFNAPGRRPSEGGIVAGVGCLAVTLYLLWIGVVIWAIIKLVSWITSQ